MAEAWLTRPLLAANEYHAGALTGLFERQHHRSVHNVATDFAVQSRD